jgi:hypothetical protein
MVYSMENPPNKRQSFPGPKDRSLEAYKVWFMEVVKRLTKEGTEIKLTEEEWIASWMDFWIEEYNR